jgi:hypothetical protein
VCVQVYPVSIMNTDAKPMKPYTAEQMRRVVEALQALQNAKPLTSGQRYHLRRWVARERIINLDRRSPGKRIHQLEAHARHAWRRLERLERNTQAQTGIEIKNRTKRHVASVAADYRYNHSAKGRARNQRYNSGPAARAAAKRYRNTDEYREHAKYRSLSRRSSLKIQENRL